MRVFSRNENGVPLCSAIWDGAGAGYPFIRSGGLIYLASSRYSENTADKKCQDAVDPR
jgi:hypothetical protein